LIHLYWCGLKMNGMVSMTREDIVRMAKEAGMESFDICVELDDFAKLVAQHEREAIAKMVEPWLLPEYVEKIRARGNIQ
jgi:hypothetical protein